MRASPPCRRDAGEEMMTMARMYVEGRVGTLDSPREAARKLMIELDAEAAAVGHRVIGDVSIYEVQHPIVEGPMLRLEADVEAV